MGVRKIYTIDEDIACRVADVAKDRGISQSKAASELLRAGWLAAYQEELASPLLPLLSRHLHALEEHMLSCLEVALEENLMEQVIEAAALKEIVLTSMALDGKLDDRRALDEAFAQAKEMMR